VISVVVPCHNYGRFLEEALASVDRQSRRADEIVIVDDGSTDDTAHVVARLVAGRDDVVVVSRTPARGAATTFNDGIRASRGDLVMVLSADDRLSPRYLEALAGRLDADASVDFAYCEARMFGAVERVEPAPPFDPRSLARNNYVNGSAMMRRSLFDRLGGFRDDLPTWEDWEFWVHAVALGARGAAVEGCWLEYRRHSGGSRNTMSHLDALRGHLRLHQLHPGVLRRSDVCARAAGAVGRRLRRNAGTRP
jgi:glycosyltransferase involved in cell wall biosynthesis